MTMDEKVAPELTFGLGTELTDDDFGEFLGVQVNDSYEPGDRGVQLAVAVKPVDFEIAGKTGAFHHWYKPSARKGSKMAYLLTGLKTVASQDKEQIADLLAAYKKVDKTATELPIGRGALNGLVCWWIRKTINYGPNKTTGENMIAEGVLIPTRAATAEEIARARGEVPSSSSSLEWTDEQVRAVLDQIVGKKPREFQLAAARARIAPELKDAILRGDAMEHLTEAGLIEMDDEGRVRELVTA